MKEKGEREQEESGEKRQEPPHKGKENQGQSKEVVKKGKKDVTKKNPPSVKGKEARDKARKEARDKARILLVDDDVLVRRTLKRVLSLGGYEVLSAAGGREALALLEKERVQLAILDLQMDDMSGTELMQIIRQRWPEIVLIMLTAHPSLESTLTAFRVGMDDYLTKPIETEELVQRLERALERLQGQDPSRAYETLQPVHSLVADSPEFLQQADIYIDRQRYEARRGGEPLPLTPTEFALLLYLMEQTGRVVPYEELASEILELQPQVESSRGTLKVHIHALRQKVEPAPSQPRYIHTVRGVGYRFQPPAPSSG